MSARAFAAFLGVAAIVALLGFGLLNESSDAIEVGDPAPDAELAFLDPARSGTQGIADYRGEWVLVNAWASWCAPCRDESPALEAFWRDHRGDNITVLGIDMQDNTTDALAFVEEFDLTYPQLRDPDDEMYDALGITGLPESYLVDPDGKIAVACPGPFVERAEVEALYRYTKDRSTDLPAFCTAEAS